MRFIHGNGIPPQLAVQRLGALSSPKLFHQRRTFAIGNIDCIGILIDEMEPLRYCPERHLTALDPFLKRSHRPLLIQSVTGKASKALEISLDGLRIARIPSAIQRFPGGADGRAEKPRRQLCPLKDGNNTLLCRPLPFPVTAARRLKDGVQPRQFPEDRREVHIHPGLDEGG